MVDPHLAPSGTTPLVRLSDTDEKKLQEALRRARDLLAGILTPVADPDYEGKQYISQPQHRLTPDDDRTIGEEYRAGRSMREVAEARSINRETVALALQRAGIKVRTSKTLSTAQLEEARALHEGGASLNRLGKMYGIDPKTMKKHLCA